MKGQKKLEKYRYICVNCNWSFCNSNLCWFIVSFCNNSHFYLTNLFVYICFLSLFVPGLRFFPIFFVYCCAFHLFLFTLWSLVKSIFVTYCNENVINQLYPSFICLVYFILLYSYRYFNIFFWRQYNNLFPTVCG